MGPAEAELGSGITGNEHCGLIEIGLPVGPVVHSEVRYPAVEPGLERIGQSRGVVERGDSEGEVWRSRRECEVASIKIDRRAQAVGQREVEKRLGERCTGIVAIAGAEVDLTDDEQRQRLDLVRISPV